MKQLLERVPEYSTVFIIGAIVPALISLNIFATKADIETVRAEIAEKYIQRGEMNQKFDEVRKSLDRLADQLERWRLGHGG